MNGQRVATDWGRRTRLETLQGWAQMHLHLQLKMSHLHLYLNAFHPNLSQFSYAFTLDSKHLHLRLNALLREGICICI